MNHAGIDHACNGVRYNAERAHAENIYIQPASRSRGEQETRDQETWTVAGWLRVSICFAVMILCTGDATLAVASPNSIQVVRVKEEGGKGVEVAGRRTLRIGDVDVDEDEDADGCAISSICILTPEHQIPRLQC